ncbi:NUDIX domain-containing protein [Kitasatospora sp. NRRL B-11411]|uniref:NUDIX domain-containing protein n=1 Tax=Kitasatospora sp. NRRL B-11411 TaxID=1463822 RepID=UPI0004C36DF0|nr:NUDIX domain-containing protein [Kitasatospora sp. NRRL B-11411]
MGDPVTLVVGVHLVLTDPVGRVLLGRRLNTSYVEGMWHTPAGHLEPGESVTAAMAREAIEELVIAIAEDALELLHALHHLDAADGRSRVQLFFGASHHDGAIRNAEPHKCAELAWWPNDALPVDTVPCTAHALSGIALGKRLSVVGCPA